MQHEPPGLDVSDFKQHLYAQLKATGVMNSLKVLYQQSSPCLGSADLQTQTCISVQKPALVDCPADSAQITGAVKAAKAGLSGAKHGYREQQCNVAEPPEQLGAAASCCKALPLHPVRVSA